MIKRIKGSLFAKAFILTAALLLCVSFIVYGALAWFMPRTYSNKLNAALDLQTQNFVSELEKVPKRDSGGLFDQFLQNENIRSVKLYSNEGMEIALPTHQDGNGNCGVAVAEAYSMPVESAPFLSGSYYFSFSDAAARYMLIVYGEAAQIAELQHSFLKVLPMLFFMILFVALTASWLFSHIITKPVLKISRISGEMSNLQLDWQLDGQRFDELGTLEKSLNFLSQKLTATLSELQTANKQLKMDIAYGKALEQARSDFFSAASHELKTPITIIKGQLEGMLLGIGAYKDREKYLTRSLEVANNLETMVQQILTISRLEAADADFKTETFDCVPIIKSFLNGAEDFITKNELQLQYDPPHTVFMNGNKLLMEMVFSNLIGNAVKYAPQGASIMIALHSGQEYCTFSVENTGTHIPAEAFPKLFDAFYRVEQSRSRKTGGSGLGLYLVQRILQRHGSACSACNTEKGVRFSFDIRRVLQ